MSAIPPLFRFLARYVIAVWLCSAMAFAANGDADPTFTFAARKTRSVAAQPNGQVLVVYDDAGYGATTLVRLDANGVKDPSFNPAVTGVIHCIAAQPDGKILLSGVFQDIYAGFSTNQIVRLLPDGRVDPTFHFSVIGKVLKMVVMADGRVLIGGSFSHIAGQSRRNIARLTADGGLDDFAPDLDDECRAIHVQADGRILVGGLFEEVNGIPRNGAARLSEDGVLDGSFTPNVTSSRAATWITEQPDGKILMILSQKSPLFSSSAFLRVDATTGATDPMFQNSLSSSASIRCASMQTDGKLLIGGSFGSNSYIYNLARLESNGQFDSSFAVPGSFSYPIHTITPTASGKLLVGGDFTTIRTANRTGIALLETDAVTTAVVAPDPTRVEWQRSGTTPMLGRVTFESRTGNSPWSLLGEGQWINGKWRLENTTVPANGVIRARGFLPATLNMPFYDDYLSIGNTQPQLTIEQGGAIIPANGTLNVGNLLSELKWEYPFKLTNTGDRKLEQITFYRPVGMSSQETLPAVLQPGESTVIRITLPTGQVGPLDSWFTITSNAAAEPHYEVNIVGTISTEISPVFHSPTDIPAPGGGILPATHTFGQLTLGFAPQPGTVLTVIRGMSVSRTLQNLPGGTIVSADFNGVTYRFIADYRSTLVAPYSLTLALLGGDGVVDKTFPVSSVTPPIAVEDDGALRYGGHRRDAAGIGDPVFNPSLNLGTPLFLTLANGDTYHASGSTISSPRLVKLRNDGSADPTFNAPIDGRVLSMAALPDGRIVIGGYFTTVSGQPRNGLALLHPDGSVDTSFDPQVNLRAYGIRTIAVQSDGKILLGTPDSSLDAVRLMPDGAVDTTFAMDSPFLDRLLIQPDGKVLRLTYRFLVLNYSKLERFHADGTPDNGFTVAADGAVRDVALLADGKLLICGDFTKIGEHACSGIARLHPDGSPDPTFLARTGAAPRQILVNGKNDILIVGDFGSVSGVAVPPNTIAQLSNPTASTQVELVNANTIRWMRQGGAAELQWVKAELVPNGGVPVSLGLAQRIPGGWEISSPTPISNATVRLYGPAVQSTGMTVMVKGLLEVGTVSPAVTVTQNEQVLPTPETHHLGTSLVGFERTATLRIRNDGAGTLRAPTVTIEGTHAADFSLVQSSPTDLASGERRSFLLKSRPLGVGLRTAQVVIRGSDPSVPAHVIPVSMTGTHTLNPVFNSSADVPHTEQGFDASVVNLGTITLGFVPSSSTLLKLVDNTGTSPINGRFMDLGERPHVPAVFNGVTYWFQLDYGTTNDIYLRGMGIGDLVPGFFVSGDAFGRSMAIQPDGKVLVSGEFTSIAGKQRSMIARLHPDGTVDESFSANIKAFSDSILVLDDGRILVGGYHSDPESSPRDAIACLHPDGSLDDSFNPVLHTNETLSTMGNRFLQLKSGKILIGGHFTSVNGIPRTNLARLNPDGSLDETFTAAIKGQSPNPGHIYSLAEQADGKLLIGGSYGSVNGTTRYCLSRLHADGTLDESFRPIIGPNTHYIYDPFGTRVSAIVQLPDGRILIGGQFETVNGTSRSRVALLNQDGTLAADFWRNIADQPVTSFAVQENGYILIGGGFGFKIAQPDGEIATGFSPKVINVSEGINSVALDREGNIWMTGGLEIPGNWPMQPIVKLKNFGGAMTLRIEQGTTATWEVLDSAPALREVEFELSTDGGAEWTPLGAATKVQNRWSLENLTLPPHGFLRAKGDGIISNRGAAHLEETLLFGRQPTAIEEWRMEQFGSLTNQRTGADLADADNDGVKNLMEYAFNLDPLNTTSAQVPVWSKDSSQFEINFTPPPNVEGVIYGAEWSSTMAPADWHDVTNQASGREHRYVVPQDQTPLKFMRVKVTNAGSLPPP